jgi:hypothetical protein
LILAVLMEGRVRTKGVVSIVRAFSRDAANTLVGVEAPALVSPGVFSTDFKPAGLLWDGVL